MVNTEKLRNMSNLLIEKYGRSGEKAVENLNVWLSGIIPYSYPEIIRKHLDECHIGLLFDAFWQIVPFGTGGRRGKVGYGPNRINLATVAMTVQGHCNYLRNYFTGRKELVVIVANDVRVFHDIAGTYRFLEGQHPLLGLSARALGRLACEIYAGNGIIVYFPKPEAELAVLGTPELSFLIGEFDAAGGVNISASHNPPDDNGIKVYDQYGSQPVAPDDQILADAMDQATNIQSLPFEKALEQNMIRNIPDALHEKYISTYVALFDNIYVPDQNIPVVFTPLCGCGLTTAGEVLERLKIPFIVPPDQHPDGSFSAIPFKAPNPEVPQSTEPARVFADENGSGIVLSSDPDADRIGVEIKLHDGSWYHFDGNQIATVLCYFLMLDPSGPKRKGLVIETLVTTRILGRIVEKAGNSFLVDDLLVGFKYMANVLKILKKEGRYRNISCSPQQLVMASEESHGVLLVPSILDKDATPACMYLAVLYQKLRKEGKTLLDYYIQILEELGVYDCVNRSIMMIGAEGIAKKDKIMESLRTLPPKAIAGFPVKKIVDYWDETVFGPFVSNTDRLPRNVLQIFTDAFVISIRPSGTEPKMKFYCHLLPDEKLASMRGMELLNAARKEAEKTARVVYNELLERIDLQLGEPGLLLPDIIDIGCKMAFEKTTIDQLHHVLAKNTYKNINDLLSWLCKETSGMTPGADPLPALKKAITYLCSQWEEKLPSVRLLKELKDWSEQ
ncbi:MAG: phospho-sugar mutase [Candidatus Kuenenia sp.]|nr:phospho-sugar mutase [Candidatus Kuenenia hertensis]